MENELTLFDNEVAGTDEEKFTTRQLAEQLNMDVKTVRENGKKCFPNKVFENGKTTYWTKPEAAALIEYMKEHNNRTDLACTTVVQATTTELTPALKIKKAMELMREGYEEELAILRAKNEEQAEKITRDAPKVNYYDRICDASGLVNIRQASKLLNIPEKKFIGTLIESGYLYRDSCGTLTPYAGRAALFAVKEWTANGKTGIQTFVTPKGIEHLLKRFGQSNKIS